MVSSDAAFRAFSQAANILASNPDKPGGAAISGICIGNSPQQAAGNTLAIHLTGYFSLDPDLVLPA